jgi:hypothetical protein
MTYVHKLAFIHTIEYHIGKSAPFQVRAKLEPLFNPLQIDIRFLPDPLPSIPSIPFTGSLPFFYKGEYRAYQVLCHE